MNDQTPIFGSAQLRNYLDLRATMERAAAAELVGFSLEEARLTDIANEKGQIDLPPWPLNHNEPEEPTMAEGTIAADELRLLVERWERLQEEKQAIADDQKDVMGEAESRGYHPATIRKVIALRKMESHDRQEAEALLQTYKAALGLD